MELGRLGVWSIGIRQVAEPAVRAAAAAPVPLPEWRAIARKVLPAWPGHLWAGLAGESGRSTCARTVAPSADSQPCRPA
jgi:hypothetical protein